MLRSQQIRVTTTGSAGSASGDGYSAGPLHGEIAAIVVNYHTDAPATSDLTLICEADDKHDAITLYSKSNSKTDATVYPHAQATDNLGAAITGWYVPLIASGRLKASLAQCDPLTDAAVITVYYRD